MSHWFGSLVTTGLLLSVAAAQEPPGRFTNLETPQTHPIEIATVSGVDYVLVCNTPDNSVEIYESAPPHLFVARIPVGLGPVSVRWHAPSGRFYTCNFDGDSIAVVRLTNDGASPSAPVLEQIAPVGDEPSDVAFDPGMLSYEDLNTLNWIDVARAYVTLSASSRFAKVDVHMPSGGGSWTVVVDDPILEAPYSPQLNSGNPNLLAVKMPRQISFDTSSDFAYVANLRGGSPAQTGDYDVAIYRFDPTSSSLGNSATVLGALGTTHHAFALRSDGERMFVVGTKAKNNATNSQGLDDVSSLVEHPTGFVESWLWVVDISSSGSMTLRSEQSASNPVAFSSINLNRDYTQTTHTAVATEDALVQPTDVLLIENSSGEVEKIVIATFHSDRIAILTPNASTNHYDIVRVNIPVRTNGSYSIAGPRGVAYSADTELLYTNGRLDNSLHVIDLITPSLTSIALQNDPTPIVIREGREFLYSNRFSIGGSGTVGGFVSCASCHVDARTDGLAWDLGEPEDGPEIEPEFRDGLTVEQEEFQEEKGRMMTQTLQGLINFHPLNEEGQFVSTNAPYYWRGARRGAQGGGPFDELNESFDSFAEAFALLQGMDEPLPSGDIEKFRHFVNTIMYPPNPEQDPSRVTPGALGEDPNDPEAEEAEGALFGMMLFHNVPAITVDPAGQVLDDDQLPRSCVDCHSLPDGSNSLATLVFPGVNLAATFEVGLETFETAGLRNISQREMWLHDPVDFGATPTHIVGNTALLHAGTPLFNDTPGGGLPTNHVTNGAQSINKFNVAFFESEMPGPDTTAQIEAITAFVRQLDTGLAPAIGRAYTVDPANATANADEFDLLEEQVEEGNIGLAVYTRNDGTVQGYWYDITASPPGYRAEGSMATPISRSALLALAADPDDVVIAQATPLGGERRWASDDGTATIIEGLSLEEDYALELLPMVTNTAYVDVHRFTDNLNEDVLTSTDPEMAKTSLWALRTLQTRVAGSFGVPSSLRHEPSRRFRVVGSTIRPGARLIVTMVETQASGSDTLDLEMDIYPVLSNTEGLVWETFVELDALHTFALLNGGYLNQDVVDIIQRDQPTSWASGYLSWNRFEVRILNEDSGGSFNPNLQTLSIEDGR